MLNEDLIAESKPISEPIERKLSVKGTILVEINIEQDCTDIIDCSEVSCTDCLIEMWQDEIDIGKITKVNLEIKK